MTLTWQVCEEPAVCSRESGAPNWSLINVSNMHRFFSVWLSLCYRFFVLQIAAIYQANRRRLSVGSTAFSVTEMSNEFHSYRLINRFLRATKRLSEYLQVTESVT